MKVMLLKLNVQLVSISLVFLVLSGCIDNKKIDKIDVFGIDREYSPRWRLKVDDINNSHSSYRESSILNESKIDSILVRLEKLTPLEGFSDVNVRSYCLLNYKDGQVDTLEIGSPAIYKYRGIVYNKDDVLLRLLNNY